VISSAFLSKTITAVVSHINAAVKRIFFSTLTGFCASQLDTPSTAPPSRVRARISNQEITPRLMSRALTFGLMAKSGRATCRPSQPSGDI
jgi:hypothetical protein